LCPYTTRAPAQYHLYLHDALPIWAGGGLETARLVGFDSFLPDPTPANSLQPDPILGTEFVYNPGFDGWMAHIYLWGHNPEGMFEDRKSTRLNSSHVKTSYAVFCLQ